MSFFLLLMMGFWTYNLLINQSIKIEIARATYGRRIKSGSSISSSFLTASVVPSVTIKKRYKPIMHRSETHTAKTTNVLPLNKVVFWRLFFMTTNKMLKTVTAIRINIKSDKLCSVITKPFLCDQVHDFVSLCYRFEFMGYKLYFSLKD